MVLPETNPETGHTIGCTCDGCQAYFRTDPFPFDADAE